MTRLVQAAWLLPCFVLFLLLGRDLIVEALNRRDVSGRSWCLDCADGLTGCDCEVSRA